MAAVIGIVINKSTLEILETIFPDYDEYLDNPRLVQRWHEPAQMIKFLDEEYEAVRYNEELLRAMIETKRHADV